MKELVSILIPTFNGEKFIAETLKSALTQTYTNLEIIVVDDFSNDNTVNIVKNHVNNDSRIKLFINDRNEGNSFSKYRCVKESKGEYLFFLDHDDLFIDEKIELQLLLINSKKSNWVGSYAFELNEITSEKTLIGSVDSNKNIIEQILSNTIRLPMCSLGFRSDFMKNSLLYKIHKPYFNKNIGFDHTQILLQFGFEPILIEYNPLCIYRRHVNNLSATSNYSIYHNKNVAYFSLILLLKSSNHRNLTFVKLWLRFVNNRLKILFK
jgi:glycosyltransferase involved in cell wall biosynthesis